MTSLNLDHAFHPAFGVPTGPFVSINCSELESHALSYPWDLLPQPRTHAHYCLLSIAYPILSNNSVSVLHLVFLRPLPLEPVSSTCLKTRTTVPLLQRFQSLF